MLSARWWTLVVWALAAAGALFWGLQLFVKAPAAPAHTRLAHAGSMARGDLTRLLGADAAPETPAAAAEPGPDARFQLIGVVSPRSPQAAREGLALIAVDGKPPRAYRIGAVIEGQNVLQSVDARGATLGPRGGAALVALNLPPPAPPATGVPTPLGGAVPGLPGLPGARIGQPFPQPQQPPQAASAQPRRVTAPGAATAVDLTSPPGEMPAQPVDAAQSR